MSEADDLTEMERRVRRVMALMVSGNWLPGASHTALMQEWDVSMTVVRTVAAEAHRLIRFAANDDKEQVRDLILAGIASVRVRSRQRKRTYMRKDGTPLTVEDPDFDAELRALELTAKMHGLLSHKVEVSAGVPLDAQFTGWSDEELEAFAADGTMPRRLRRGGDGDGLH